MGHFLIPSPMKDLDDNGNFLRSSKAWRRFCFCCYGIWDSWAQLRSDTSVFCQSHLLTHFAVDHSFQSSADGEAHERTVSRPMHIDNIYQARVWECQQIAIMTCLSNRFWLRSSVSQRAWPKDLTLYNISGMRELSLHPTSRWYSLTCLRALNFGQSPGTLFA